MKKHLSIVLGAMMISGTMMTGCKKDSVPELNEEELITTVNLIFTDKATQAKSTFSFKDPDGDGGLPPSLFENIVLTAGKSYTCDIELLDESKNPVENITDEVEAEGDDHQFYFEVAGVDVNISGLNVDANGLPLGTSSTWVCGTQGVGSVKVTLKHKPGIKAAGDPVSKGETDIELTFNTRIQ